MTADATEDRRIGDPDPRIVRRERKRWLIAVVIIVVVAVPSIFYFSGAYDRWQDGRSLASSCRGSVDTSEVRELLGVDRLRGHDIEVEQGANPSSGQLHKCSVRDPDAAWMAISGTGLGFRRGGGSSRLRRLHPIRRCRNGDSARSRMARRDG